MNYNKARAVINRVMQEGGYIGKCTYNKNQHCANLGSGGGVASIARPQCKNLA